MSHSKKSNLFLGWQLLPILLLSLYLLSILSLTHTYLQKFCLVLKVCVSLLVSSTQSPIPLFKNYGDLQLSPEVVHLPQLEVPYPFTNGGQQFQARQWQLSSSILLHILKNTKVNYHSKAWLPFQKKNIPKEPFICHPLQ